MLVLYNIVISPQGDLAAAREVFNAFFKFYPYCYGYWKKLADLERTHAGNDSAKQVSASLCLELRHKYVIFYVLS